MFVHEDHRRTLVDWAEGDFKAAKAVVAKEACVLGRHYHRHKDESFLLVSGCCEAAIVGNQCFAAVMAPHFWHVPRGTYHEFHLQAGSVLMGVATAAFDPADEIAGSPNG